MTNLLKQFAGWFLSCVFGVIGGYFYSHLHAAPTEKVTITRSSRFELTDETGRVIAFWGADRGNNTVLAFLQKTVGDVDSKGFKFPAEQTGFGGQSPNEALSVGMLSTQSPFINLLGKDGNPRAVLYLTQQQKPILNMGDESRETRLELGFISNDSPAPNDDDWALRFRTPDVAGIGSMKNPVDHKYRGYLSVERNPKEK